MTLHDIRRLGYFPSGVLVHCEECGAQFKTKKNTTGKCCSRDCADVYLRKNAAARRNVTAESLREMMSYDPNTGIFTWIMPKKPELVATVAGSPDVNGYIQIGISGKRHKAHRLAWLYVHGEWPKYTIDHINRNPGDNRIANLRDVPNRINQRNRKVRIDSGTGLRGVRFSKAKGKFEARISAHLGEFDSPEAAYEAYCAAARLLFGEHAGLT